MANNVAQMNGERPSKLIKLCWYIISPAFVVIIWSFNWYDVATSNELITYGTYKFNAGAMSFGWSVAFLSILSIPLGALHTIYKLPSDMSLLTVICSFLILSIILGIILIVDFYVLKKIKHSIQPIIADLQPSKEEEFFNRKLKMLDEENPKFTVPKFETYF